MTGIEHDHHFEEHPITEVRDAKTHWAIESDGAWLHVEKAKLTGKPQVGQIARYYGKGFGYGVRGVAIDGRVAYYETEQEYAARVRREQQERDAGQKAAADARRPEADAEVAKLPPCFRKRIERFRRNNLDFYWQHEPYEMAACMDAVKIADALRGDDDPLDSLQTFHALPWEEQKRVVPELSDGHSGNTFGMACRLARHYLVDDRLVFAEHAAIAVLVGCEEAGCPPVTDDEMRAAGYEPWTTETT